MKKVIGIFIIGLSLVACNEHNSPMSGRIQALQQVIDNRVEQDISALATFESSYSLVYKNFKKKNLWRGNGFYVREEVATVPYGYQLSDMDIKVMVENNIEYLQVRLPKQPKRLPIDRHTVKTKMTSTDYQVKDEAGNLVDVDAKLHQELQSLLIKYEADTFQRGRNLTHQYFMNLAKSLGLVLQLKFVE